VSISLHHIPTGPGAQQFERMSRTTTRNSSSRVISARNVVEKAHAVSSAHSSVPFALNKGSTTSPTNNGTCNLNP
jgi:hypothetical protein